MKILAILVGLVLAGCGSTEKFDANLNSFIGKSENALLMAWGPPQASGVGDDGVKFMRWSQARNVTVPGTAPSYSTTCFGLNCTSTPIGGTPDMTVNLNCSVIFAVHEGIVRAWRRSGNNCVA